MRADRRSKISLGDEMYGVFVTGCLAGDQMYHTSLLGIYSTHRKAIEAVEEAPAEMEHSVLPCARDAEKEDFYVCELAIDIPPLLWSNRMCNIFGGRVVPRGQSPK